LILAMLLVASSAGADELPTIDSALPPTIRIGGGNYRAHVRRVAVDLRRAPGVSWLRVELDATWQVALPIDLPRGARVMGMTVERDDVEVWAPPMRKAISDETLLHGEVATIIEPVGMTGDEEHFLLRASRGSFAVTLALALPQAAEIAIDAERSERLAITRDDQPVTAVIGGPTRVDTRMLPGSVVGAPPIGFALEGDRSSRVPPISEPVAVDQANSISAREIRRAIQLQEPRMRWCYMKGLQRDPELAGTAMLKFRIGRDGKVTGTVESDLPVEITGCIGDVLASIELREGDAQIDVNYPLTFRPTGS
jgi:hypothetical protein